MTAQRAICVGATLAVLLVSFLLQLFIKRNALNEGEDIIISRQSNTMDTSWTGWVECNIGSRSCHFSNIIDRNDGSFELYIDKFSRKLVRVAGLLLSEGIGTPANYYYIDSWSFLPQGQRHPIESKLRSRLASEMERYKGICKFIPIYLKPSSSIGCMDNLAIEFKPTLLFSILWPENFFRTVYACLSAYSTLRSWNLRAENMSLVVNDEALESGGFLKEMEDTGLFHGKENIGKPKLYKSLFLGLSTESLLDEAKFKVESFGQALKLQTFPEFSKLVRNSLEISSTTSHEKNLVVFVRRRQSDRSIINEYELLLDLEKMTGIRIVHVYLEDLSLADQVDLMSRTKLLIATHGAALTHILFLPKGSYVLEIFPFGFRKTIYRHLARIMGVKYLSYQVSSVSATKFLISGVDKKLLKDCLSSGEVNWFCDQEEATCHICKNVWRKQQFYVNPADLYRTIEMVLPFDDPKYMRDKFLLFMPWEQLNNQILGFKSACALAQYTGRTLVVPPVGYWDSKLAPKGQRVETRRDFDPAHYRWKSMERYYNVYGGKFPCKLAPWDSVTSLIPKLDQILYTVLMKTPAYWQQKVQSFYWDIGGMSWDFRTIGPLPFIGRPVHIPRWKVRKRIIPLMSKRVVGLGSMFYFWNFGQILDYPLTRFQDFMGNKLYRSLLLPFNPDLKHLANTLVSCSKSPLKGQVYDAAHVRKGDYRQKCREKGEGKLLNRRHMLSCYQTKRYLTSRLKLKAVSGQPLFIATNTDLEFQSQRMVIYQKDLISALRISKPDRDCSLVALRRAWKMALVMDPNERAILDQLLCILAPGIFTGNYFSSFTRTISDHRNITKLASEFF